MGLRGEGCTVGPGVLAGEKCTFTERLSPPRLKGSEIKPGSARLLVSALVCIPLSLFFTSAHSIMCEGEENRSADPTDSFPSGDSQL